MKKPALTILVLLAERLARVDLDARGKVVESFVRRRAAHADGSAAVLHLLTRTPARRTIVVDESLWSQTLDLPRAQIEGLDDAAISTALAFELEPMCGIPATEADVAWIRDESRDRDTTTFWITTSKRADRERIAAVLAERGSRLATYLHPAGVVNDGPAIEVFTLTTLLANGSDFPRVLAASSGQRSWRTAVDAFLATPGVGPTGTVLALRGATNVVLPLLAATSGCRVRDSISLAKDDVADFAAYATCVVAALATRHVPALSPVAKRRPVLGPLRVGVFLTALVALLIARDASTLATRAASAEREATEKERAKGIDDRARSERDRRTALLSELRTSVAAERARLTATDTALTPQRRRIDDLLAAAAECCPEGAMLSGIEMDSNGGFVLRGLATSQPLVSEYAKNLIDRFRRDADLSLVVHPPETHSSTIEGNTTLTEFSLRIDLGIDATDTNTGGKG